MRRFLAWVQTARWLPAFAAVALGWMVLVILEGAVVRATGSGAGCGNHWPLCNGEFIPHHPRIATIIEFTHRSMTGICSAFVAAVIAWTFVARSAGHRARKAAVWAGVLLVTEALLGAVLVKGGFVEHNTSDARVIVQCIHFTNTLLLLGALTLTWWWQRRRPELPSPQAALRPSVWLALGFTVLTGATGSVAALADTLFPSPNLRSALAADLSASSRLLVRMRWIHPAASCGAFVCIALLAWRLKDHRGGRVLISLLLAQFALGFADVLALAPLSLQLLHLLGADLLWMALICTSAQVLLPMPATLTEGERTSLSGTLTPKNA